MKLWIPLLRWYDREGRDLPWRKTRDPYRILVSEIMLQQTQVSRVLDYYPLWLKRFPNWRALARASNGEVIHAWAGLGYNRRGLMLRDVARHIVKVGIPRTYTGWLDLKGIGPYTADALAVFSMHERRLPIDTNIRRTAGRILLGKGAPQAGDDERIRGKSENLLPLKGRFYDVPQALFDLAVSICQKTPRCEVCPMRKECLFAPKFLSGRARLPKRLTPKAKESVREGKKYPDRIYRGRILALVRTSAQSVRISEIGTRIDPGFDPRDSEWLESMIARMAKDGLLKRTASRISLA